MNGFLLYLGRNFIFFIKKHKGHIMTDKIKSSLKTNKQKNINSS